MLISPREPVALFVSAWIEIYLDKSTNRSPFVALFVSAWIEIATYGYLPILSLVALFVSAWIEMSIVLRNR